MEYYLGNRACLDRSCQRKVDPGCGNVTERGLDGRARHALGRALDLECGDSGGDLSVGHDD